MIFVSGLVFVCFFFVFHFDCQLMFCNMTICFRAASFLLSALGSVRRKGDEWLC